VATDPDAPLAQSAPPLLLRSIQRLDPTYDPQPDGALLQALCAELGGYPLGLSMLAPYLVSDAGRMRLAALRQDWSRLDTPWLDTPHRQSGLALLVEDIWDGLSPAARRCAMGFCVFADGAELSACVAVLAGDEWEALPQQIEQLQQASLLQRQGRRYTMHAILRHLIRGQLRADDAQEEEARRRHGCYYLARVATNSDDQLVVQEERDAFAAREHDNLRAAWKWAIEQRAWELLAESLPALYHYFETACLFHEGERWLSQLYQRLQADDDRPARLYAQTTTTSLRPPQSGSNMPDSSSKPPCSKTRPSGAPPPSSPPTSDDATTQRHPAHSQA